MTHQLSNGVQVEKNGKYWEITHGQHSVSLTDDELDELKKVTP